MVLTDTVIPDVKVIVCDRHRDHRGYFCETYSKPAFAELGIAEEFIQDNESHSAKRGTLRGLHFQIPPFAQAKLVRVLRGAILDVAVDIRRRSPTFGRHVAVELNDDDGKQIYIPVGFAHGFLTLTDGVRVAYKVDARYDGASCRGIMWNDATLEIDWPVDRNAVILSPGDLTWPAFKGLPAYFAA